MQKTSIFALKHQNVQCAVEAESRVAKVADSDMPRFKTPNRVISFASFVKFYMGFEDMLERVAAFISFSEVLLCRLSHRNRPTTC